MSDFAQNRLPLFDDSSEPTSPSQPRPETGAVIPLEMNSQDEQAKDRKITSPELPARWEAAREVAERKNVLPFLLKQIRRVQALDYLQYLISLSKDEGYIWVVYGNSGSGKSSFFHTLEYQTNNQIRTHIIDGNNEKVDLSDHIAFSQYLNGVIRHHKDKNGEDIPLVVVLEERENSMTSDERSAISQTLRNVLRPPGPGKNTVFVLPVTNSNHGTLFIEQARDTGVSIPLGHNAIFTFQGPPYTEHVDILSSLFSALNGRDISDYGLQRSDLQAHVSSQQTIGQYIRTIREELVKQNTKFMQTVKISNYKPFTVIMCFVNPLPSYQTEPIIKGMTTNAVGKIRTGEILRVTQSQKAQRWQGKHQSLANVVEALDIRIVEMSPEIVTKTLYIYGWNTPLSGEYTEDTRKTIEKHLEEENIDYRAPKATRQYLRKQLGASNLFQIIFNKETRSYPTPRFSKSNNEELSKQEQERRNKEMAEINITNLACQTSNKHQHELHGMFAQAIEDLLNNSGNTVSDFKAVYPEAWMTLTDNKGNAKKTIRPDVVIEMQDRLYFLEFCWRSDDHFTYADVASYVLRKIQESYMNLPLIQALSES